MEPDKWYPFKQVIQYNTKFVKRHVAVASEALKQYPVREVWLQSIRGKYSNVMNKTSQCSVIYPDSES